MNLYEFVLIKKAKTDKNDHVTPPAVIARGNDLFADTVEDARDQILMDFAGNIEENGGRKEVEIQIRPFLGG